MNVEVSCILLLLGILNTRLTHLYDLLLLNHKKVSFMSSSKFTLIKALKMLHE